MANTNAPRGFVAIGHMNGGQAPMHDYTIASTYGTALGAGDPVEMTGTGRNIQVSATTNVNSIGVFAGCSYTDSTGKRIYADYWPAGTTATNIVAHVLDDPFTLFEIQCDSLAEGDVGSVSDYTVGTPSATTGQSTTYLAVSAATSGKCIQILGLSRKPNNAYGAYAKAQVRFASHAYLTGAAAAGAF